MARRLDVLGAEGAGRKGGGAECGVRKAGRAHRCGGPAKGAPGGGSCPACPGIRPVPGRHRAGSKRNTPLRALVGTGYRAPASCTAGAREAITRCPIWGG
ncbi:hypothetical protein HOK021_01860 [Streptomyces hygroscopicus]|nr:hypothetical protein HOK021_01860 [Streptomyces hygroscopicus]